MRPSKPPEQDSQPQEAARALGIAYAYLNRRERTVAEVRSRLERAELTESEVEAAVEELIGFGYLDDARYARMFAQDKRHLEQWGRDRIERALRERGIDRELIVTALAEEQPGGELERAVTLLQARFPTGPVQARDGERAFGMLLRKGYESEMAADAVREWRAGAAD